MCNFISCKKKLNSNKSQTLTYRMLIRLNKILLHFPDQKNQRRPEYHFIIVEKSVPYLADISSTDSSYTITRIFFTDTTPFFCTCFVYYYIFYFFLTFRTGITYMGIYPYIQRIENIFSVAH